MRVLLINRDMFGGALFVLLGIGASALGATYGIGSLTHMGPGFFPVALGAVMAALGGVLLIEGSQPRSGGESEATDELGKAVARHEWRGFSAIIVGIVAFIALGKLFGLAPAALGCVFISALGDRTATVKSAAVLAVVTSLFAVGFFSYVLGVQFPVWQWPALGSGP